METWKCPDCGAPIAPDTAQCPYCGIHFRKQAAAEGPPNHSQAPAVSRVVFQRMTEPNEGAFTVAVPQGWQIEGGIIRANLMNQVVDAQSIEPKVDFSVKRDAAGSVMIRWGPEIKYCDLRMTPAGMMGMFPPGSYYQGMMVSPVVPAAQFLIQFAFPWAHPQASQVEVLSQETQPLLVQGYQRRIAAMGIPLNFQYDGGLVTFSYLESGTRYREKAQTVIENMGPVAGGMWSNKDTVLMRAAENEFDAWEPILHHIRESVKISQPWLAREIVNQEFLSQSFLNAQQASMARDRRMLEVQQQLQQMDRQIVDHRQRTNAEIQNDQYLNLMNLEEYVNPHTNEIDIGSNQWHHRWANGNGDEFYTDDETIDPNVSSLLNCSDWKRTPVRPRFPQ
jgi:hypothetical protein